MPFAVKDWHDDPTHDTPVTAAALKDVEQRLSDYAAQNLRDKALPAPGAGQDQKGFVWDQASGAWVYYDPATQAELDAHTGLTTSAHGGIVASSDARLPWNEGTHAARLATAAPAAGTAGRRWFETDTGVLYFDTGTIWRPVSVGQVVKTADETVNNSAVLQDDDELKFPIEPNESWFVEALLLAQGASLNADWKLGFTGPAGATAQWASMGGSSNPGMSFIGVVAATTPVVLQAIGASIALGGVAGTYGIQLQGWFTAAATAGIIQLQWAQNTATVENNKILKNSLLRLRRLV